MRFSSNNMEGRIKSKTKFINEGVELLWDPWWPTFNKTTSSTFI